MYRHKYIKMKEELITVNNYKLTIIVTITLIMQHEL